jgi:NTE family protein
MAVRRKLASTPPALTSIEETWRANCSSKSLKSFYDGPPLLSGLVEWGCRAGMPKSSLGVEAARKAARGIGNYWVTAWRRFSRQGTELVAPAAPSPAKIGIALGGGFARGIAHAGLLKVLEQNQIPIHCITGVSAGAIVAAAYASGAEPDEIARVGSSMRFNDIGRWSLGWMGFAASERMKTFLERLLKKYRFEEMPIPLGIIATDLATGDAVPFHGEGEVVLPIRASCAYPGLFHPVKHQGRLLVDGAMSIEVPARLARQLGATHVISVHVPNCEGSLPRNVFQVVNQCFQILHRRTEESWRKESDLVVELAVGAVQWDGFSSAPDLIRAGEAAALKILPAIREWMPQGPQEPDGVTPGSEPASPSRCAPRSSFEEAAAHK